MRRLPSMAALKGFEACARHLNFSQAASELHLTQSAISHQIRQLEDTLGVALFERGASGVQLTEEGALLLPVARRLFGDMNRAMDAFAERARRTTTLEVWLHDSFASTWLIPRLASFQLVAPDIRLRITSDDTPRFEQGGVAIRLAPLDRTWPGLHAETILRERMFPVCSPTLIEAHGLPSTPADILGYPLIVRARYRLGGEPVDTPSWAYWLAHHGLNLDGANPVLSVPHSSLAVQAAGHGLGVAMARTSHLGDELRAGKLQRLWHEDLDTGSGYHFLCAPGRERDGEVRTFLHWLRQVCGA